MIIRFEKDIVNNYEAAIQHEWVERNNLGAYAATTIIGANTRREHGLFVIPNPEDQRRIVVLAKMEESVFVDNRLYELSTNSYADAVFPGGYRHIDSFELMPFPRTHFLVEDRKLQKTVFLLKESNILLIRYELRNQGRPVKIIVKPFLAVRGSHEINTETQGLNTDSYLGQNWVRWAPRRNMPELYALFSAGEYVPATLWYHNFYYPDDRYQYQQLNEDLFNPGFFQCELKPYQTLDLMIAAENIADFEFDYEALFRKEMATRVQQPERPFQQIKTTFMRAIPLENRALPITTTLLNETQATRDFLFTLPALLTQRDTISQFKQQYQLLLPYFESGLLAANFPAEKGRRRFNQADLSLWFIVLGYFYFLQTRDLSVITEAWFDLWRSIVDFYRKGTLFNLFADDDGLIFCGDKKNSLSWIPLPDEQGHVLRYGKLLEINALWYNVLRIMEFFSSEIGKRRLQNRYRKWADQVLQSFNRTFLPDKENQFYDFVRYEVKNSDFRINQLVPLALPFKLIEAEKANAIFQRIQKELVTPYGIRSYNQEPTEETQHQVMNRKTVRYYQGGIWTWPIALYVHAYLNVKHTQKIERNDFWNYFSPLFELLHSGTLGYLPEAVFYNQHVHQEGIRDFLPTLSSVIWADWLLTRAQR